MTQKKIKQENVEMKLMMAKTKEKEENTLEKTEQIQLLEQQNKVLMDLINLKEVNYYRQQKLMLMERQALATERMAIALEESSSEEDEVPDIEPPEK